MPDTTDDMTTTAAPETAPDGPLASPLRQLLERTKAEAEANPEAFRRAPHEDADEPTYDPSLELTRKRLAYLDVPPLYADVSLERFVLHGETEDERQTLARAFRSARRIAALWPKAPLIAVFCGGPGTGKTHCAYAIARYVVEHCRATALVVVLSDAIRDLREAWGSNEPGGMSEAARLARYRNADLLVIDEVSRHAFYGQPTQHLYDLVAWREVRRRPTILTTNERGDGLSVTLGDALMSRAICHRAIVDFGADDYRRVIASTATSAAADERATRRSA